MCISLWSRTYITKIWFDLNSSNLNWVKDTVLLATMSSQVVNLHKKQNKLDLTTCEVKLVTQGCGILRPNWNSNNEPLIMCNLNILNPQFWPVKIRWNLTINSYVWNRIVSWIIIKRKLGFTYCSFRNTDDTATGQTFSFALLYLHSLFLVLFVHL